MCGCVDVRQLFLSIKQAFGKMCKRDRGTTCFATRAGACTITSALLYNARIIQRAMHKINPNYDGFGPKKSDMHITSEQCILGPKC